MNTILYENRSHYYSLRGPRIVNVDRDTRPRRWRPAVRARRPCPRSRAYGAFLG
jgi:hypothetical protein